MSAIADSKIPRHVRGPAVGHHLFLLLRAKGWAFPMRLSGFMVGMLEPEKGEARFSAQRRVCDRTRNRSWLLRLTHEVYPRKSGKLHVLVIDAFAVV